MLQSLAKKRCTQTKSHCIERFHLNWHLSHWLYVHIITKNQRVLLFSIDSLSAFQLELPLIRCGAWPIKKSATESLNRIDRLSSNIGSNFQLWPYNYQPNFRMPRKTSRRKLTLIFFSADFTIHMFGVAEMFPFAVQRNVSQPKSTTNSNRDKFQATVGK